MVMTVMPAKYPDKWQVYSEVTLSYEGAVLFMKTDYIIYVLSGHYRHSCIKNASLNMD
jgi:hypothetical protein